VSESQSRLQTFAQTAACLTVVAWGVVEASGLITTILLALLLAYSVLPLPRWIMRRFSLSKAGAIAWTVTLAGLSYLLVLAYLINTGYRMKAKLPVYQERLIAIYDSMAPFLAAHGIRLSSLPTETLFSLDRIIGLARVVVPAAAGSLSTGLLIFLLSLLFLIELSEPTARQNSLVAALTRYGYDVQQFIAITAKTGASRAGEPSATGARGRGFPAGLVCAVLLPAIHPQRRGYLRSDPAHAGCVRHAGLGEGADCSRRHDPGQSSDGDRA